MLIFAHTLEHIVNNNPVTTAPSYLSDAAGDSQTAGERFVKYLSDY